MLLLTAPCRAVDHLVCARREIPAELQPRRRPCHAVGQADVHVHRLQQPTRRRRNPAGACTTQLDHAGRV